MTDIKPEMDLEPDIIESFKTVDLLEEKITLLEKKTENKINKLDCEIKQLNHIVKMYCVKKED
jgi:hypothetical protein